MQGSPLPGHHELERVLPVGQHVQRKQGKRYAARPAVLAEHPASRILPVDRKPPLVPAVAHQGMLFFRERAELEAGQDPRRVVKVLIDEEARKVYDDGERPCPWWSL